MMHINAEIALRAAETAQTILLVKPVSIIGFSLPNQAQDRQIRIGNAFHVLHIAVTALSMRHKRELFVSNAFLHSLL